MEAVAQLEADVEATRRRLQDLEQRLQEARCRLVADGVEYNVSRSSDGAVGGGNFAWEAAASFVSTSGSLTKDDIERFARQIVLEDIGTAGMDRIRRGRVLLVGAGGLGSTAALYLAAAGVGELCIVDFDVVESSNLHRQIIHRTTRVGMSKAESAAQSCLDINPHVGVRVVTAAFTPANAEELVRNCDVVVDGSDNVATRYLVNDAAARHRRPLVSGSALRWEGQLSVYCNGPCCPCYRCLFPTPPPADAVGSCNDTGVVGPVPGCIGCMQAIETLKLLAGAGEVLGGRLLLFDALRMQVRVVELRRRQEGCSACGEVARPESNRSLQQLAPERPEYVMASCASSGSLSASELPVGSRVTPSVFFKVLQGVVEGEGPPRIAVDVRPREQYDMAHLPHCISLPLKQLEAWARDGVLERKWEELADSIIRCDEGQVDVYVICRRGISSVKAVKLLLPLQEPHSLTVETGSVTRTLKQRSTRRCFQFINVDGGLNRYHHEVDKNFPFY